MKTLKTSAVTAVLGASLLLLGGCGQGWNNFVQCGDVNKQYNPTTYDCVGDTAEHANDFDDIQISQTPRATEIL